MGLHMKTPQLENLVVHMDKAQIGCIDFRFVRIYIHFL